jgi:hypothetical protein
MSSGILFDTMKWVPAMKKLFKLTLYLVLFAWLSACSARQVTPVPPTATSVSKATASADNQTRTLSSLQQVDDHPLYTMRYYGTYDPPRTVMQPAVHKTDPTPGWACSLFTVLLDDEHQLYGRNFDWQFSPALLLFTDPPDGYASVSMVDIEYLGFSNTEVSHLTDLPLEKLQGLLEAPSIPFDGMNEHGLAIGMAAVPPGNMQTDSSKKTIGSLGVMRQILDHARNVDEAVKIVSDYNIDFDGGPPIHYLIADANRKSVLVEFYQGKMNIITNDKPWHSATNFLRSSVEDPRGQCWRYDKISARLNDTQGMIDSKSAMGLLSEVAQDNTQWSVVYQMALGEVSVAMNKDYTKIQTFQLSDYLDLK